MVERGRARRRVVNSSRVGGDRYGSNPRSEMGGWSRTGWGTRRSFPSLRAGTQRCLVRYSGDWDGFWLCSQSRKASSCGSLDTDDSCGSSFSRNLTYCGATDMSITPYAGNKDQPLEEAKPSCPLAVFSASAYTSPVHDLSAVAEQRLAKPFNGTWHTYHQHAVHPKMHYGERTFSGQVHPEPGTLDQMLMHCNMSFRKDSHLALSRTSCDGSSHKCFGLVRAACIRNCIWQFVSGPT